MAKTIKRRREISDFDAQSIESFLNGDLKSYQNYQPVKYTVDPAFGQEVLDVLTDNTIDHGIFMTESLSYLNEADSIYRSLETYVNTRKLKIKMCNAFAQAAQRQGYGIEAIDFWRSLEDGANNNNAAGGQPPANNNAADQGQNNNNQDQKRKGTNGDDAWYKKFWASVTMFFKKLVMAVINFVKTIGNFVKGALCKAQDLFYKKYAKDVKANIQRYADNPDNKELKFKCKATNDDQMWNVAPWEVLKQVSGKLVQEFAKQQQAMVNTNQLIGGMYQQNNAGDGASKLENIKTNLANEIAGVFKIEGVNNVDAISKKIADTHGKWFPQTGAVANLIVYGVEKPSKKELPLMNVLNATTVEILSPGSLTAMNFAFKTAQQANKSLTTCYKAANKYAAQSNKFGGGDQSGGAKAAIRDYMMAMQNMARFTSSLLITLYGTCLSCRMTVFNAARKLYKKGEYASDNQNAQGGDQNAQGEDQNAQGEQSELDNSIIEVDLSKASRAEKNEYNKLLNNYRKETDAGKKAKALGILNGKALELNQKYKK